MFFNAQNNFYQYVEDYENQTFSINLYIKNFSINFYFMYYDIETETYLPRELYQLDFNPTLESNISMIENIDFYLTQEASQIENKIFKELSCDFTVYNQYIISFENILEKFFVTNKNIQNSLFKKLFLSFIFELYHCNTFTNSTYYNQLKNNFIFKIFGTKLQYLIAKKMAQEKAGLISEKNAETHFKKLEKEWINTLFDKRNETQLQYAYTYKLILSSEEELEHILDQKRISQLNHHQDKELINIASEYFLSVFNISKAFDLVTNNRSKPILYAMRISLLSLLIFLFFPNSCIPQGLLIYWLPSVLLAILIIFSLPISIAPTSPFLSLNHSQNKSSYLTILLMPRLFFSILISWMALVTSFDLFYAHVHQSFWNHFTLNILIFLTIGLYFWIKTPYRTLKKTKDIITVASFISLVQGFFILKFYLNTFIKRSFTQENFNNFEDVNRSLLNTYPYKQEINQSIITEKSPYQLISDVPNINLFFSPDDSLYHFFNIDVYVLFSLFLLPVFFGLILQNIMDDKPSVFKPLK